MIDTKKYGMTNKELLERFSNLSVDDYKELLAEVERLRKRLEVFDCMRFDIEHAIDHSWASWEDLKVFLKEMIE